jgi:hypothetical protein
VEQEQDLEQDPEIEEEVAVEAEVLEEEAERIREKVSRAERRKHGTPLPSLEDSLKTEKSLLLMKFADFPSQSKKALLSTTF